MVRDFLTRDGVRAVALSSAAALAVGLAASRAPGASRHALAARTGGRSSAERRCRYQNPTLPISQRVADLLGRMTLAEKIGQMTQAERADVDADPSLITAARPRQRAVRRRLGADAEHAGGVGRHGRPLPGGRARTPGSASR